MGNSSAKGFSRPQTSYTSQCSLSNIISCTGTTESVYEEFRPWSRISRRTWSEGTLNDPLNSAKTAWPVPRFEAIFLPEFRVREEPIKIHYTFLELIAKGAYGRVYKVEDKKHGKIYALKMISKSRVIEEDAVNQAKQEVAIQKAVGHHPFIAHSDHYWQGRKTLYILTEYVGGGELYDLVNEYVKLPEQVVRIYVAEIALALDFLHNAGIVHRDLKATNVLLDEEGHAVLIDFGLAKWLKRGHRTGTFCGTPEYMAPEILKKEYYGHEIDWWSLGVLIFFMLTNKYPVMTIEETTDDHPIVRTSFDTQDITKSAVDLLKRLLQPNPRLRLKSILELQRIGFFMGFDIRSYTLKEVSPFQLLGRRINCQQSAKQKIPSSNTFRDFDSFVGGSTNRKWD